jgi:predicted NBD/HSP70 family sugar kinase
MIIAVDTGGTKTLIASFDNTGEMSVLSRFPTPTDKRDYIRALTNEISSKVESSEIDAISIAAPGPISDGILFRSPNIGWKDFAIVDELQKYFKNIPISLKNDADLGALSESKQRNESHSIGMYITLSTGIGAGLTYDSHLFSGLDHFEVGDIHLENNGLLERWEDIASGKNFYERYGMLGNEVDDDNIWQDYALRVAKGLVVVIPLFEPKFVVIGGSMGTHYHKYAHHLKKILADSIPDHIKNVDLSQATNPEEAVIYGCYYYAVDNLVN